MADEKILIGTSDVIQAGRYRDQLAREGVHLELVHNPSTCRTGCRTTVELWARPEDLDAVRLAIGREEARNWAGLDFDPKLLNEVFDPAKGQAVCPACGTQFETAHKECPDCGLCF